MGYPRLIFDKKSNKNIFVIIISTIGTTRIHFRVGKEVVGIPIQACIVHSNVFIR